ncbi:protein Z, vitamin K-dependent plasma glycoprotein a [Eucyclogobius newberryi]|uniref:protein Z, vitamin K-dependent plasma glycoprotein a n=1 Tax=Eucyclogobius newberryi TaxID=166745 RepID=UPI003B5984B5
MPVAMSPLAVPTSLLLLVVGAWATHQTPEKVFLDKDEASAVISRQKRNQPSNLEKECMEKICTYDEAHRFFQDTYRTDIFWSVYVDGDQCLSNPCQNGALCSDSAGGYDCVCKSGFSGAHCEKDETICPSEKDKGCSQFCKPGYSSYDCSCAQGWRMSRTDRNKCEPAVSNPCGKVSSLSQWESRQKSIRDNNFQGLTCTLTECPWQALLKSGESAGYCSGVILKSNMVLTSAQCAKKYSDFQVVVGTRKTTPEDGEQTLLVNLVHFHPRYIEGRPENDLAVIELRDPIRFKREVVAVCLPERDFADHILASGGYPAVVTGWKETTDQTSFQGPLTLNQLAYDTLSHCLGTYPMIMTNKMGCTLQRANADCSVSSGSPLLTLYREVFFLTGIITKPADADCSAGYIFQKVSRHLDWLQPLMGPR